MTKYNCFKCEKRIKPAFKGDKGTTTGFYMPLDAVNFDGSGGYGSEYDMSPRFQIIICDKCLDNQIANGYVYSDVTKTPEVKAVNEIVKVDEKFLQQGWLR